MATPDEIANQLVRYTRELFNNKRSHQYFCQRVEELVGSQQFHQPIAYSVAQSLKRLGFDTGNTKMGPLLDTISSDMPLKVLLDHITFSLCAHISPNFEL